MDAKFASRKFLLTLLVVAIAVGMNWLGKLSPELVEVLKWSLGLYCGFNVTQRAAEWIAQKV
jgi:hypothetical protein